MNTKIIFPIILIIFFTMLPGISHAQLDPGCNPDLPCPIDGGLSLLIAAGIGIGVKKAYGLRKNSRQCTVDGGQESNV